MPGGCTSSLICVMAPGSTFRAEGVALRLDRIPDHPTRGHTHKECSL